MLLSILFPYNLIFKAFKAVISIFQRLSFFKFIYRLGLRITQSMIFTIVIAIAYFIIYSQIIPKVEQSTQLSLRRTANGYHSRIFQLGQDFPYCDHLKLTDQEEDSINSIKYKACVDPFNIYDQAIDFEEQTYWMGVILNVPATEYNMRLNSVKVKAEFISVNNQTHEVNAYALCSPRPPGYLKKLSIFLRNLLGMDPDYELQVILAENFTNDFFKVQVINIEILEPYLSLNHVKFRMKAQLSGWKSFMYNWFWIASFINIYILKKIAKMIMRMLQDVISSVMAKILNFYGNGIKWANNFLFSTKRKILEWVWIK